MQTIIKSKEFSFGYDDGRWTFNLGDGWERFTHSNLDKVFEIIINNQYGIHIYNWIHNNNIADYAEMWFCATFKFVWTKLFYRYAENFVSQIWIDNDRMKMARGEAVSEPWESYTDFTYDWRPSIYFEVMKGNNLL